MSRLGPNPDLAAHRERQQRLRRRLRLRGPLGRLTLGLDLEDPAPVAEIVAAQMALRVKFPPDYHAFLVASNGGHGRVGRVTLTLWPVHRLRANNEARGSERGLVVFGTGSGGEEFAFSGDGVLRIPATGKLAGRETLGSTFLEFLKGLAE